jgi:hypothetical protein
MASNGQDYVDDGSDSWEWEDDLKENLARILSTAQLELRETDEGEERVVTFDDPEWSEHEFTDYEEMFHALVEYGDSFLASRVPWEDGSPVFSTESDDIVMDAIADSQVEELFFGPRKPNKDQLLFNFEEPQRIVQIDFADISEEIIKYLAANPERMRTIHHRRFEELVAELLRAKGYEVDLTQRNGRSQVALTPVLRVQEVLNVLNEQPFR